MIGIIRVTFRKIAASLFQKNEVTGFYRKTFVFHRIIGFSTQYLISCGSKYVNSEGKLIDNPVWIAPPGKNVTISGLSSNTNYTFTAKAKNGDGYETDASDLKSGKTLALPPQILEFPENRQKSIKIAWSAIPGATAYEIEVDGNVVNNGLSNTYTHTGLQPETSHAYRVRVKNAGGTGNWSALYSQSTLIDNPGLPANIQTSFSKTEVTLSWDPAFKASGYEIEVDGIVQDNGSSRIYTHHDLEPESNHTYRVRAKNSGGYSNWSEYIQITTLPNPPIPPEQISTMITKNTVQIEWAPNIKADRYEIEVDGFISNNGSATIYFHDGLVPLTAHTYRIRGVNAGGTGEWSQTFIVTTHPYEPYTPENVMA
jgi:chitodextrinase